MSVDISVLIRGSVSADDVHDELRAEGLRLAPTETGVWSGSIGGVDIALIADPGLEDDAGLSSSKFGVQISLTRFSSEDGELQEAFMVALGPLLAQRFARRRLWRCLVVRNLQVKLAEYG